MRCVTGSECRYVGGRCYYCGKEGVGSPALAGGRVEAPEPPPPEAAPEPPPPFGEVLTCTWDPANPTESKPLGDIARSLVKKGFRLLDAKGRPTDFDPDAGFVRVVRPIPAMERTPECPATK